MAVLLCEYRVYVACASVGFLAVLYGVSGTAIKAGQTLRALGAAPDGAALSERNGVGGADAFALAATNAGICGEKLIGRTHFIWVTRCEREHDSEWVAHFALDVFLCGETRCDLMCLATTVFKLKSLLVALNGIGKIRAIINGFHGK